MANKQSGLAQKFMVGGRDISGDVGAFNSIDARRALLDITAIDKSAYERIVGLRDGSIDFNVFYNPTGQAHAALKALPTTDVICMAFMAQTLGEPVACLRAKQVNYDWKRSQDGAMLGNVNAQANDFGLEWCLALTAGVKVDNAAANGTSIDRQSYGLVGVSSAFGAAAYLEVFAFAGTSITVKVQDSADNSTFADITGLSFTAVSAVPAQERLETGLTATIRRYVRAISTGTFSPASFAVAFIDYLTARDP